MIIQTPVGMMRIICSEKRIRRIIWMDEKMQQLQAQTENHGITDKVASWIDDYFSQKKPPSLEEKFFDWQETSQFTYSVLQKARDLPYGSVINYGSLAHSLNTAPRAVGQALARNPFPLLIPCHRIVGKGCNGSIILKGYLGRDGTDRTKLLLSHENSQLFID